jgi:lipopolysaccharide biosynthesis regulator YciM
LEELYEEVKDWENAFRSQEIINKLSKSENQNVLAHLVTEHGKSQMAQGDRKGASRTFRRAISIDPKCVDAYLHFGDLHAEEGQDEKAVAMWKKVMEVSPSMTFLAYDRLEHAFFRLGKVETLEEFLRERSAGEETDLFTRLFLAKHLRKKGELEEALIVLRGILDQWPDSREGRQELIELLVLQGSKDKALEEYEKLLRSITVIDRHFQCRMCGYTSSQLQWKCPQCHRWDTLGVWEKESQDDGEED